MRHMRTLFLMIFILSSAGLAWAEQTEKTIDPTGTWTWEQTFGSNKVDIELRLVLQDETLTGTYKSIFAAGSRFRPGRNQAIEISNAKLDGDELYFEVVRKFGNNEFTTTFSGVIVGDEIAGLTLANFGGEDRESEWMAKRVSREASTTVEPNVQEEAETAETETEELKPASAEGSARFRGPSREDIAAASPGRIPSPGLATDEPYQPQPILPGGIVVPLYARDSSALNPDRVREAEKYNMSKGVPGRIQSIVNIHNPSIEIHRADPSINTGTVVILAAGGGHRTLNVGTEAGDFVPFFYNYGVNCIILRNRLRSDGYKPEEDAVNDALQAIRLVRAYAAEWEINPNRIGIVGFSAGAELSGPAAIRFEEFDKQHVVEDGRLSGVSARPDFVGLLYPGPTPFTREPETPVPRNAPPSFVATPGSGDQIHAIWAMDYFNAMLRAGIPNIELHVYGNGEHAGRLPCPSGIRADGHRRSLASALVTFPNTILGTATLKCSYFRRFDISAEAIFPANGPFRESHFKECWH